MIRLICELLQLAYISSLVIEQICDLSGLAEGNMPKDILEVSEILMAKLNLPRDFGHRAMRVYSPTNT